MTSRLVRTNLIAGLAVLCMAFASQTAYSQIVATPAGVEIDAAGVLRTTTYPDPTGQLTRELRNAAKTNLDSDLLRKSKLRKVSLNRLEKEVARRLAQNEPLDGAIRNLAGLTEISYVFFYPESGDIVLAGPAEGFYADLSGRVVGFHSGKATLRLEDLIVALRAFSPEDPSVRVIGCSIDPTQEGLVEFQNAYASFGGSANAGADVIMDTFRTALGKQVVSIEGVSPKSHFAQVLVEADYRMKLIGIGLEEPPVNIPSWIENVNPTDVAQNALQRWYFTPDYERILVSEDENAMKLVGNGVKLIGEDERVQADGSRVGSQRKDRASRGFTSAFTKKYDVLADREPVFAELRNLVDLSIAAAFIKEMDYYGASGWDLGVFADEAALNTDTYQHPTHVEPAINGVWKNNFFMAPIGGGVHIQPRLALTADHMKHDESGKVHQTRYNIKLDELEEGQWWWD